MSGQDKIIFDKVCLIGIGLIGSSMAHAMRAQGLAKTISIYDIDPAARDVARELNLGHAVCDSVEAAVT
ncbi:MAG TPA: prephenate/arogenate dehydrogenase family protein, partial [Stellaceae bacterium]|nr:prephenate/arogenate dehydrogenase family protein [Stellaceae bacterium]